jgi:DnaJ family protein C protein 25
MRRPPPPRPPPPLRALQCVALLLPAAVRGAGRRAQDGALDLYCHAQNCYELLGVEPSATLYEVKRAFRSISRKHHPDSRRATARSPEIFREAANAYEILTDDDARTNYDYYLAHPHEHASNQFRYYQYRAKVIPGGSWTILALLLLVLSVIQHQSAKTRYGMAVRYWKRMDGTLKRAKEEALVRLEDAVHPLKKGKKHKKEDVKREMEKWMDEMVETGKLQVKGGYGKPNWRNLLCIRTFLLPYTLYTGFLWRQGLKQ